MQVTPFLAPFGVCGVCGVCVRVRACVIYPTHRQTEREERKEAHTHCVFQHIYADCVCVSHSMYMYIRSIYLVCEVHNMHFVQVRVTPYLVRVYTYCNSMISSVEFQTHHTQREERKERERRERPHTKHTRTGSRQMSILSNVTTHFPFHPCATIRTTTFSSSNES